MQFLKPHRHAVKPLAPALVDTEYGLYREEYFHELLSLERKRSERSRHPLRLMLLDIMRIIDGDARREFAGRAAETLSAATRETDIKGWYARDAVIGILFTETNGVEPRALRRKVEAQLMAAVPEEQRGNILISFHALPEDLDARQETVADMALYPELPRQTRSRKAALFAKRAMDVLGAVAAFALFAPFFLLIPAAIKLTSKGPVLFRQKRVGQHGKPFQFLKFRSMYVNNDETVHREYIRNFIAGSGGTGPDGNGGGKAVYKITDDKRVTPIGSLLRKTSLDEFPQFINVLRGDMSLVGPRPPIPYEVERYDLWHRRRVMEIKPGITGLWQVRGRSSTTFDEMVRLDLQYAKEWSLWMDVKILLRTPWAVLRGKGAY